MSHPPDRVATLSLDLSNAPPVLYLYGLAGAGKNFVGDIVGRLAGWHVYHADQDVTEEMQLAIAEKRTFTPEMRDRYFAIVADKIVELRRTHERLIVTQATYKTQHRRYLVSRIPDMDLVCVTASDSSIVERLLSRGDDVTPEYAAKMRLNFEAPSLDSRIIVNNGGEAEIVTQLTKFYGKV